MLKLKRVIKRKHKLIVLIRETYSAKNVKLLLKQAHEIGLKNEKMSVELTGE